MTSNYKNRKARGQCAQCTNKALPGGVRCEKCRDKHRRKWSETPEELKAEWRERAFQRSMERERRLEEIDAQLKQEIAELEKALAE